MKTGQQHAVDAASLVSMDDRRGLSSCFFRCFPFSRIPHPAIRELLRDGQVDEAHALISDRYPTALSTRPLCASLASNVC